MENEYKYFISNLNFLNPQLSPNLRMKSKEALAALANQERFNQKKNIEQKLWANIVPWSNVVLFEPKQPRGRGEVKVTHDYALVAPVLTRIFSRYILVPCVMNYSDNFFLCSKDFFQSHFVPSKFQLISIYINNIQSREHSLEIT